MIVSQARAESTMNQSARKEGGIDQSYCHHYGRVKLIRAVTGAASVPMTAPGGGSDRRSDVRGVR